MRLKELRNKKEITQIELAENLKISRVNYNRYENQQIEPDIKTLCKLADYYKVSLDYLVGRNFQNDIGYLTEPQKTAVGLIKELNEINLIKGISYLAGLVAGQ